ncbi:MAG: hypothetical protein ABGZ53_08870 [Fuerstiella sp.]
MSVLKPSGMMKSKPIDENQNPGFGIYGSAEETMRGRLHHRLESLQISKSGFCLRLWQKQDSDRAGVRGHQEKAMSTSTLKAHYRLHHEFDAALSPCGKWSLSGLAACSIRHYQRLTRHSQKSSATGRVGRSPVF